MTIYCRMVDLRDRKYSQKDAMAEARAAMAAYPDLRLVVQEVKLFGGSAFKNAQVELSIRGPDSDKLDAYAAEVVKWMRADPRFTDVDTNAAVRTPEMQVVIERKKAGALNVNVQAIASTLGVLVGGEPISKFKDGPDQYDVWLRADLKNRDRRESISSLTVPSSTGQLVELRNVAELEAARGPATIERYNRQRQVTVTCNLAPGIPLGNVLRSSTRKWNRWGCRRNIKPSNSARRS